MYACELSRSRQKEAYYAFSDLVICPNLAKHYSKNGIICIHYPQNATMREYFWILEDGFDHDKRAKEQTWK